MYCNYPNIYIYIYDFRTPKIIILTTKMLTCIKKKYLITLICTFCRYYKSKEKNINILLNRYFITTYIVYYYIKKKIRENYPT